MSQALIPSAEYALTPFLQSDGVVVQLLLDALPNTLAIYAFGSRIQGAANADSDLDLAVLVAGYAEPLQLWELASQLSDTACCPVDLLDLRAASTVMQYQVLTQGQQLWAQQPDADLFACFVLNEKNNLDAARAGLIADIQQQGKVYGR